MTRRNREKILTQKYSVMNEFRRRSASTDRTVFTSDDRINFTKIRVIRGAPAKRTIRRDDRDQERARESSNP
jgi:hypothetical protein